MLVAGTAEAFFGASHTSYSIQASCRVVTELCVGFVVLILQVNLASINKYILLMQMAQAYCCYVR